MFRNPLGESLPYRLFVPPDYDARKGTPLVLRLEGNGSQGNDLELPEWRRWPSVFLSPSTQRKYPAFVLTPRCLRGQYWSRFTSFDSWCFRNCSRTASSPTVSVADVR
jgi:predicted peptidase